VIYLDWLEKLHITPNFWCSEEYFEKAELLQNRTGHKGSPNPGTILSVANEGWTMFPAIDTATRQLVWFDKTWSDFSGCFSPQGYSKTFLDYAYIYDPVNFTRMEGGDWAVFRKNCRKFSKRFPDFKFTYSTPEDYPFEDLDGWLYQLFQNWLLSKDEEVKDDKVAEAFLTQGRNRKILWDHDGFVWGVNIWDENWEYINFRFCFCRPGDFLSEYMRWLFYTDPLILNKKKLVNDGGVLDNLNLKNFKDKLNPLFVRDVFSWRKI